MLEILYGSPLETLRSFSTMDDEVWIGFAPSCQLHVDGEGVAPHHCRLYRDDQGRWVAEPHALTLVNGRPPSSAVFVGPADRLQIGSMTLQLKPTSYEPKEQELIAGARDDLAGRAVYADWLEERGQWDRAEFLRLTVSAAGMAPTDPGFADVTMRIQKLAGCLDITWRMELSADAVEGCVRREFTCSVKWDDLMPTAEPFVRSCGSCNHRVYYCRSEYEASNHARDGHCIVLDVGIHRGLVDRRPRQLDATPIAPPPGMYLPTFYQPPPLRTCGGCGYVPPVGFRFCPQCGAPVTP